MSESKNPFEELDVIEHCPVPNRRHQDWQAGYEARKSEEGAELERLLKIETAKIGYKLGQFAFLLDEVKDGR